MALAATALLFVPRSARALDSTDVFARIARARAPMKTLKGPFTQTRKLGLLATEVRSQGLLALVRPDRLRWELRPPDDVTFWVGPEGLSYRSTHGSGTLPATTARVAAALDDLRTLLGGDLNRLRERWVLRVLRDDPTGVEIDATPRAATSGDIASMRFALAADLVRPLRAVLTFGPRDATTIEFGELQVNAPIDEVSMHPPS
jgi:hypothetical protein